jgi:hypothetical protein
MEDQWSTSTAHSMYSWTPVRLAGRHRGDTKSNDEEGEQLVMNSTPFVNPGTNSGTPSKRIAQHAKIAMCLVLQWYLAVSTRPSHEAIDSAPPPAAEPFHQTLHDATINQLPTSSSSQPPTPSTSHCVHRHTTHLLIRRLSHKAEHCLSRERES